MAKNKRMMTDNITVILISLNSGLQIAGAGSTMMGQDMQDED